MADWTHLICVSCWRKAYPDRQTQPLYGVETENCCFCGQSATQTITMREDPATLPCKGTTTGIHAKREYE